MMIPMTNGTTLPRGKAPAQPARPHLMLASGITATLPAAPSAVDYYTRIMVIGMLVNDRLGDCVIAYMGHAVEQVTEYATGTEQVVTDPATVSLYSAITGYDPSQDSPDGNPTDQGTSMQDALTYWRKTGVYTDSQGRAHKIAAFAGVSLTDWNEIENAVDWFGHVAVGFNFPDSAMTQFNAGEPWTVVKGSPTDGGHCVMLVGYDADWLYVLTWGQVQKMARAFWAEYVDEAWVPVTQETITSQGANAFGGLLNLVALGQAFANLTHDPNPFPDAPTPVPDPSPAPDPQPTPDPDPEPVIAIDAADRRLHDNPRVRHLLNAHGFSDLLHDVKHALQRWEQDKGPW